MKLGVLGVLTVAGVLSGTGIASAATAPTGVIDSAEVVASQGVTNVAVRVSGEITLTRDQHGSRSGNNAQPPAAPVQPPAAEGQMSVKAGYPWLSGRNGAASGVRIRANVPSGTVVGLLPQYARLWMSCQRYAGGTWWAWIAYNTGSRWIYGFSSLQYVFPSPDRALPNC